MRFAIDDVLKFHVAAGSGVAEVPRFPSEEVRALRQRLIDEEHREWKEAEENDDMVGIIDGLADLIYVILGTAIEYVGPRTFLHAWEEVQRSNMEKVVEGKLVRRPSDGKVLKPEGWEPPQIAAVIELARRGGTPEFEMSSAEELELLRRQKRELGRQLNRERACRHGLQQEVAGLQAGIESLQARLREGGDARTATLRSEIAWALVELEEGDVEGAKAFLNRAQGRSAEAALGEPFVHPAAENAEETLLRWAHLLRKHPPRRFAVIAQTQKESVMCEFHDGGDPAQLAQMLYDQASEMAPGELHEESPPVDIANYDRVFEVIVDSPWATCDIRERVEVPAGQDAEKLCREQYAQILEIDFPAGWDEIDDDEGSSVSPSCEEG